MSKSLGYKVKFAIHPSQVNVIRNSFKYTEEIGLNILCLLTSSYINCTKTSLFSNLEYNSFAILLVSIICILFKYNII